MTHLEAYAYEYILCSAIPEEGGDKIPQQAKHYLLQDHLLYLKQEKDQSRLYLVVPTAQCKVIFETYHAELPGGGHFECKKTIGKTVLLARNEEIHY